MSGLPGLQYSDDIVPPSPKRARLEDRAIDEEAEFELDDEDFYEDAQKPSQSFVQPPSASPDDQAKENLAMSNGLPGLAFPAVAPKTPPPAETYTIPQFDETPRVEETEEPNFYEAIPTVQPAVLSELPDVEPVSAPELEAVIDDEEEGITEDDNTVMKDVDAPAQPSAEQDAPVKTGASSLLDDLDFLIQPQATVHKNESGDMAVTSGRHQSLLEKSGEASGNDSGHAVRVPVLATETDDRADQRSEDFPTEVPEKPMVEAAISTTVDSAGTVKVTDDKDFLAMAAANKSDPSAEWQFDSSDAESADSSSSEDSSSDDDSDDGELLDPDTTAKMLLDAIGDDEDGPAPSGPLKTVNEKDEEILPKPDITVTPEMEITELGFVDSIVGSFMLIRGITSGNYRVVEAGSALCTADRTVIGAVMEPMGRVQQPMYSMGFKDAEQLTQAGVQKDTKIFYVNDHSTYVFTEPLKAFKGTDASNIHDEETGLDEIEFSDDEKEAEYKRNVKQSKKDRKGGNNAKQNRQDNPPQGPKSKQPFKHPDASASNGHSKPISYDDNDDDDEGGEIYHRLSRPDNLHEMMSYREPIEDRSNRGRPGPRGRGNDRGFGRGGRGGQNNRGGGRGQTPQRDFNNNNKGGRGQGHGQNQGQRGGFQNVPTGPRNGSQHNSPKGKRKNRREYSDSPRPVSRSQYEESTSNPQRTPPPMPPPLPQYPAAPVAGQGYPPVPPPPPLDPAALMAMLPPGSHFNPQMFAQNAMQYAQGQQSHAQQQHIAPPSDPRLRNPSPVQTQWQPALPPPPPPAYQQYPPPPVPYSQQYAYGAQQHQQQQTPPAPQSNTPQGQIDLAALLRNLTGGGRN